MRVYFSRMTKHEQLVELLATRSARTGEFTLASGARSNLYIDARMTAMSPEGLALIGPLALGELRLAGWKADSVGGLTLGADPISYAIAYASALAETPRTRVYGPQRGQNPRDRQVDRGAIPAIRSGSGHRGCDHNRRLRTQGDTCNPERGSFRNWCPFASGSRGRREGANRDRRLQRSVTCHGSRDYPANKINAE